MNERDALARLRVAVRQEGASAGVDEVRAKRDRLLGASRIGACPDRDQEGDRRRRAHDAERLRPRGEGHSRDEPAPARHPAMSAYLKRGGLVPRAIGTATP